jgi:hypothetical protein
MLIRPYPHIYLRRRDMVQTMGMIICVPIVVFLFSQNGWNGRDTIALGILVLFIIVTRLVTLAVDAKLRRHTRYELRDDGLYIFRNDNLVIVIPTGDLDQIYPGSVDGQGWGSAELPHQPLTDGRALNRWTLLIPAFYADAELSVVPEIAKVCALIRAEANKSSAIAVENSSDVR